MSAGGLARIGIRCADASTGMATIGIFCGALVIPPDVGGGSSKRRQHPITHGNKNTAFREDEDFIAVLQAFLNRRH